MMEILQGVINYFIHQFSFLFQPNHGLFLGYIISAFIIATVYCCYELRSYNIFIGVKHILRMHKINSISVLDDIKVFVFDKLVLGFMYSFLFGVAYYTKAETINILSYLGVPSLSYEVTFFLTFLFTLGAVIVFDFATFIEHYLAHKIRFLWEFHKVHHIPETLNPLTAYRSHPVNQGMFVIIAGVFSGFYSGALNVFFPNQNLFLIYADQNVFMFIFLFLGLNLQHSHIQLRYPPVIRSILVSPAYHQLHHSSAIEHYDKNFGFIFSFWDKLFGTQVLVTTPIKIKFGIKGEDYFEYSGLLNHYITPFKRVKILLSNKLRGRHKDIPNVMDG